MRNHLRECLFWLGWVNGQYWYHLHCFWLTRLRHKGVYDAVQSLYMITITNSRGQNAINCKHMTITFLVKLVLAPTILMLTWYLHDIDIHESFGAIVLFMVQNYTAQSSRFMHQSQHKFLRIIIPAYNCSLKESPLSWFMGCCWVSNPC